MNFPEGHRFAQLLDVPETVLQLSRLIPREYLLMDLHTSKVEDTLWELTSPSQGQGTAFPHFCEVKEVLPCMHAFIMGISRDGIAFGNPNGELTHFFFLLLDPNETAHLRLLSRLAGFAQKEGMKERLLAAATTDEVIKLLLNLWHSP